MKVKILTNNNKLPSEKSFGISFSLVFVLLGIYLSFNRIFLFDLLSYILSFFILIISIDNPNSLARLNILWGRLGNFFLVKDEQPANLIKSYKDLYELD